MLVGPGQTLQAIKNTDGADTIDLFISLWYIAFSSGVGIPLDRAS